MNSKQILVTVFAILLGVLTRPCEAEGSGVNWRDGVLTAQGFGAPKTGVTPAQAKILAATAARMDAYRNLLVILKGVQITSERTVQDTLVTDDRITGRVEGIVQGARQVGKTSYDEDGIATVTMAIGLRGPLLDKVLPQAGFGKKASLLAPPEGRKSTQITGLIVEAAELSLLPALAPKILDEDRGLVYGAEMVDRDAAVTFGMVAYETDVASARENGRAGDNPLVVKGTAATGRGRSNVTISSMDGVRIKMAAAQSTFLNQCKVVFVTGE